MGLRICMASKLPSDAAQLRPHLEVHRKIQPQTLDSVSEPMNRKHTHTHTHTLKKKGKIKELQTRKSMPMDPSL